MRAGWRTLAAMMMAEMPGAARLTEPPLELLRRAAGGPRDLGRKAVALTRAMRTLFDGRELDARLNRLATLGYVDHAPTRAQLVIGSLDMLRFWIEPAARDYYASRGIGFGFHQVLRVLDDPTSMIDPTGFLSSVDTIIGHLMQVVHANPRYDLELLESHDGGLDELERQVLAMLDGTHPRATSIGAIVEDPDYHARLLGYVREYRADRGARPPIRENVAASPRFQTLERTFGSLPAAMRYFTRLPPGWSACVRHLMRVREFPERLAEPAPS